MDVKIEVKFSSHKDEFSAANVSLLVPTSLDRKGLSLVINHLLDSEIEFDFILNDKFLSGSIKTYIESNGISIVYFL